VEDGTGVEGAVRGEGTHLADRCIDKTRVMPFIPLHACPRHGSWATFIRVIHARAKSEILTL
jgi:hypothetical protein